MFIIIIFNTKWETKSRCAWHLRPLLLLLRIKQDTSQAREVMKNLTGSMKMKVVMRVFMKDKRALMLILTDHPRCAKVSAGKTRELSSLTLRKKLFRFNRKLDLRETSKKTISRRLS